MRIRISALLLVVGCGLLGTSTHLSAQTIAAGASHSVVVKPDGSVWTFGANNFGQLGDGTTTQRTTPVHVPALSGIVAVAAGADHTLALESNGNVWAWGRNATGQLGDGTNTTRTTPVAVAGLPPIAAIAAGASHSVALATNGTVWTWGLNSSGQLGNGTTTTSLQPLIIVTGWTATAVKAGHTNTLAVRADGTVWAWGANGSGQLGASSPTQWTVPAMVTGVSGAVSASGGNCHTVVLSADGSVRTSGCNSWGQLGNNTTVNRASMDAVPSLQNVAAVRAGHSFNSVLTTSGEVWSWGSSLFGQSGTGVTTTRLIPVRTSITAAVTQLATGHAHALAVTTAGVVMAWGENGNGQLGDGTTVNRLTPIAISDVNYQWKVATPTLSLASGNYTTDRTVVVTNATAGAQLHYSLDGQDPTPSDPAVTSGSSLAVDRTMTLKVRGWKDGMPPSDIVSATYTMSVSLPAVTPGGGTYTTTQTVTVSTTTPNASLRYTTDNSTPTGSSTLYTEPLQVSTTTTLKVIGFRSGWSNSTQRTATYNLDFGALPAPQMTPTAGTYTSSAVVSITATDGATIRYTTNGTTPTSFSPIYTAPLAISTTQTVKAIAFHPDYATSPVTTALYTIVAAAPVFTPGGGSYSATQSITVTCDTPGATIRYTLDGRDPTDTDVIIANNGILIAGNYALKAKAFKAGTTASPVTTAVYQTTGALTAPQVDGGFSSSILGRPDGLAWAWGSKPGNGTSSSLLPVAPANLTGVTSVSAGGQHMVLTTADGSVHAWGTNLNGQLGDATTTQRLTAVRLTTVTNAARVSAGGKHSVLVKQDGTVWTWGLNTQGQLGDGTTVQRTSPVVVSGLAGVVAVAAGEDFTLALKGDGTVWSWGNNADGQLGDGSTTDRLQPVRITPLSNVVAIAAGFGHGLALRSDGSVWVWGDNTAGQLGSYPEQLGPVVVGGLPTITGVAAGGYHSLALAANGSVLAWGSNGFGELGDGTTEHRITAAAVPSLGGIIAIGAGHNHSLAIGSNGTVWSWGGNGVGQLGDGTADGKLSPVPISGPGYYWQVYTPAVTPASGVYTAVQAAVVTSQDPGATLRYTINGSEPTEADAVIASGGSIPIAQSTVVKVAAWKPGAPRSITVVRTYELKALPPTIALAAGSYSGTMTATVANPNPEGTLTFTVDGSEPTIASTVYSTAVNVNQTLTLKAVAHRTGWTSSATSYASYWITEGTVATPTITPAAGVYVTPRLVTLASSTSGAVIRYTLDGTEPMEASRSYQFPFLVSATTTVKARAFKAGMSTSAVASAVYAIDAAGAVATPTVVPAGGRFTTRQTVSIEAPAAATVRYTTDGRDPAEGDPALGPERTIVVDRSQVLKVRAWEAGSTPSAVRTAFFVISGQVAAGTLHTVALKADGTVWSWGYNNYGGIGDGTTTNRLSPVQVSLTDVRSVAAGYAHSLALRSDGTVWAWGLNICGQLGDNTLTNRSTPVQVAALTSVVAIAAGGDAFLSSHSLALKADGTVWAWGCNQQGQLGDGTTTGRKTPVQVTGLQGATGIAAGAAHSFALAAIGSESGVVWAWGKNAERQLGDGSSTMRSVPVRVVGVANVTRVTASQSGAIALRGDGTVWGWGSGPLVIGPPEPSQLPVVARVLSIAAGDDHALALDADAIRWGWGRAFDGELGTGVATLGSNAAELASNRLREGSPVTMDADGGRSHSVLLRADGTVAVMGDNQYGQLGIGTTTDAPLPVAIAGFSLVNNTWLASDGDGDGLTAWREWLAGTDPYNPDSNGNGILDGIENGLGPNGANPDTDGDGLTNTEELQRGIDPFALDSDGDGVGDGVDAFPLDPTRSSLPPPNPADTTPPVITLTQPTTARPVGGGGGL